MNSTMGIDREKWKDNGDLTSKLNLLFCSLSIMSGFAVGLRLYTKTSAQQARLWWDDWIAVTAWVRSQLEWLASIDSSKKKKKKKKRKCVLTLLLRFPPKFIILMLNIAAVFELRNGEGRHASDLPAEELSQFTLSANVAATMAIVVTTLSKSGFCVTLLARLGAWPRGGDVDRATGDVEVARIRALRETRAAANRDGKTTESVLRGIVWSVLASMNLVSMVAGILLWVRCSPMEKAWHPNVRGTCWGETAIITPAMVNTAFSGAMDIVLCVVPMYMLRNTPLRRGERAGVMFCLLLGLVASATGFLKTTEVHILAGPDVTFDIVPLTIWGSAEPNLILMAISLPEARHLFWKGSMYDGRAATPQGLRNAIDHPVTGPDDKAYEAQATQSTRTSRDDLWDVLSYYGVGQPPSARGGVMGRPRESWLARYAHKPAARPREAGASSGQPSRSAEMAARADLRSDRSGYPQGGQF
ncbi:hypothetical protein RB593_008193 [Gaeumannomyces tritici]